MKTNQFFITAATAIAVVGTIGFAYAESTDASSYSAKPVAAAPATTSSDSNDVKGSPASDKSNDAKPAPAPLAAKADRN